MLTSYDDPLDNTKDSSYIYDVEGRRISKTVNSVETKYFYNGQNVETEYNSDDTEIASYLIFHLDSPLCMSRGGNAYYYLKDAIGSIVTLLDSPNNNVANRYEYEAFGGDAQNPTVTVENPYKFAARRWDDESSQYYNRRRYYIPGIGRFSQADPAGAQSGDNLYLYTSNRPTVATDPSGLWKSKRLGLRRAPLVPDKEDIGKPLEESIKEFAEDKLHLDSTEVEEWIRIHKLLPSPLIPQRVYRDHIVKKGEVYSAPNVIFATVGDVRVARNWIMYGYNKAAWCTATRLVRNHVVALPLFKGHSGKCHTDYQWCTPYTPSDWCKVRKTDKHKWPGAHGLLVGFPLIP